MKLSGGLASGAFLILVSILVSLTGMPSGGRHPVLAGEGGQVAPHAGRDLSVFNCFAYSPAGDLIALSDRNTIQLRHTSDMKVVRILDGHAGPACRLKFSSDGSHLATLGLDDELRLWDVKTGRQVREFPGIKSDKAEFDVSRGGERVAVSFRDDVRVWDPEEEEPLYVIRDFVQRQFDSGKHGATPIRHILFSADGARLIVVAASAHVHDVASGQEVAASEEIRSGTWAVALPEALITAWTSVSSGGSGITVIDYEGRVKASFELPGLTLKAASVLSGKGELVIAGYPRRPLSTMEQLAESRRALDALRRGRIIKNPGFVGLVNLKKKKLVKSVKSERAFRRISASSDGKTVAIGDGESGIRFLKTSTLKPLRSLGVPLRRESVASAAFAGEDGLLLVRSAFRDERDSSRVMTFGFDDEAATWTCGETPLGKGVSVRSVKSAPEAGLIVVGMADGEVTAWSWSEGKKVFRAPMAPLREGSKKKTRQRLTVVGFDPDSSRVLAGGEGWISSCALGSKKVTHSTLPAGAGGKPKVIWFSEDGTHAVAAIPAKKKGKSALLLADTTSSSDVRTFAGKEVSFTSCSLSEDGKHLLGGTRDGEVLVWERASGRLVKTLEGHRGSVTAILPLADTDLLATASDDGTIRLWDKDDWGEDRILAGRSCRYRGLAWDANTSRLLGVTRASVEFWAVDEGEHQGRILLLGNRKGQRSGKEWVAVNADGLFASSRGALSALSLRRDGALVDDAEALEALRDPATVWSDLRGP